MKEKQLTLGEKILNALEFDSSYRNIKLNAGRIKPSGAEFNTVRRNPPINNEMLINDREIKISLTQTTGDFDDSASISELEEKIHNCKKCPISSLRKNFVFGTGNTKSKIVVIGEAPGKDEDEQGKPFVGRAGKLLTDILKAINLTREEVFIANILKCRPPDNRNPLPSEIVNCFPYLVKQMKLINPEYILAVGTFAGQTILKSKDALGRMRAKVHTVNFFGKEVKAVVTYHPAALLRNPNWKKPAWEDVKLFRSIYEKTLKH